MTAGQVTFQIDQQVATVSVQISGDTLPEGDQTLRGAERR
jgi:hypothetical protein